MSDPELHRSDRDRLIPRTAESFTPMLRQWFDAREVVDFATQLARDIDAAFKSEGKAKSAKKHQRRFDSIIQRTRGFGKNHRLNVYKKAKFLNTIRWHLRDAGHDEVFVKEMVALLTPLL